MAPTNHRESWEQGGATPEQVMQKINALQARTDWHVYNDNHCLPCPLHVSPKIVEQMSAAEETPMRAIAGLVRQRLFPMWLVQRAEKNIAPLQLDITEPFNASWFLLGLPRAFYLSDESMMSEADVSALSVSAFSETTLAKAMSGENAFFAHTNGEQAFYAPIFERGDAPPVTIAGLKRSVEEMARAGQEIMLTYYVSGPGLNQRIEVPDYNGADDKEHLDVMLNVMCQDGLMRIVGVGEVWFRTDDGEATWDGVQIEEMTRTTTTQWIAPYEGRKLGKWKIA